MRNVQNIDLGEIEVSPYFPANWYTELGAIKKMNLLQKKGLPQFTNWRFVTLTVDPLKFTNSEKAYHYIKKRFRYFIRDLKNYLDVKHLRWISKLEFQENGWAHWHMLIDYRKPICVSTLKDIWGYGLVDIRRCKDRVMPYTFKYITKHAEGLPCWFLKLSRPRVLQTSGIFPSSVRSEKESSPGKTEEDSEGKPESLGTRLKRYSKMIQYRTARSKFPVTMKTSISWGKFFLQACKNHFFRFESPMRVILPINYLTKIEIQIS